MLCWPGSDHPSIRVSEFVRDSKQLSFKHIFYTQTSQSKAHTYPQPPPLANSHMPSSKPPRSQITPGPGPRRLGTMAFVRSLPKLFKQYNPELAHLAPPASPLPPHQNHNIGSGHASPHALPPRHLASWCLSLWPCMAGHGRSSWEL